MLQENVIYAQYLHRTYLSYQSQEHMSIFSVVLASNGRSFLARYRENRPKIDVYARVRARIYEMATRVEYIRTIIRSRMSFVEHVMLLTSVLVASKNSEGSTRTELFELAKDTWAMFYPRGQYLHKPFNFVRNIRRVWYDISSDISDAIVSMPSEFILLALYCLNCSRLVGYIAGKKISTFVS